jgi:hypothetical protein
MIVNLSNCYYVNNSVINTTDSTLLKVIKIAVSVFLEAVAFFIGSATKLLVNRNGIGKKDEIVSCAPHDITQKCFKELHAQKYQIFFTKQKEILERVLDEFNVCTKGCIEAEFREFFALNSSPIHRLLTRAIEILLKSHCIEEVRADYVKYNRALRETLVTDEYIHNKSSTFAQIIQELCFGKFVETNLADWEEEFIFQRIIPHNEQKITAKNLSQLIKDGNAALKGAPRQVKKSIFSLYWGNACNAAGVESDQLIGPNIPELRSIHTVTCDSTSFPIYYIRHPTPTIEPGVSALAARIIGGNATIIAPEYIGFLDALVRKNIPFLYVNHQYMEKESESSNVFLSADNNRGEAIQRLEDSHKEVFHFLSLPLDGPIVQEIHKNDLSSWKKNLVDILIEERNGFRLPKKFKDAELTHTEKKTAIAKLLNSVQNLYFPGKSMLNKRQRRVLLVIFYSYIKEYFKAEYKISLMASVCKDNKDRGGISACIDEALFTLRLGKEESQQALQDLRLRALAPFMIKYQEIVEHRLEVLLDVLDHIAKLEQAQKAIIRAFKVHDYYEVIDQNVPRGINR